MTKTCGVYYLWDGTQVLYIGCSKNIEGRISAHRRRFDFAGYFIDKCEEGQLLDKEAQAIREFRPKYNIANTFCAWGEDNSGHIKSERKPLRMNTGKSQPVFL